MGVLDWIGKHLPGGDEAAAASPAPETPEECARNPAHHPELRKKAAKRALKTPAVETPAAPAAVVKDEKGMTGRDWADVGLSGANVLGGVLTALGEGDPSRGRYDLPGAAGPDALALGGVDKPFTGRMEMTPEQRQSLALAMLK